MAASREQPAACKILASRDATITDATNPSSAGTTHMRTLVVILLSLLLGVASTVAIAWRFAWTQLQLSTDTIDGSPAPRSVGPVPTSAPGVETPAKVFVAMGVAPGTERWDVAYYKADQLPDTATSRGDLQIPTWVRRIVVPWEFNAAWRGDDLHSGMIIARGWPSVTLWSGTRLRSNNTMFDNGAFYFEGSIRHYGPRRSLVLYPSAAAFDVPFPLRPIWTPFLISSTLLAIPFYVMFAAPGALRRWSLRRRQRCIRCAYDRQGLTHATPCPECGLTPQPKS